MTALCVVDQNPTHRLSRDGEKMLPVLPIAALLPGDLEKCFVNKCGWLESMALPLAPHIRSSALVKLVVNERQQLVKHFFSAAVPLSKELSDV
jgi:hypothetical protein